MTSTFPKSARLLTRRDFLFRRYETLETGPFKFLVNLAGRGRLGISVAKRVIKSSPGRNRVKRLLREAFRSKRDRFRNYDIIIIARNQLGKTWKSLDLTCIQGVFDQLLVRLPAESQLSS